MKMTVLVIDSEDEDIREMAVSTVPTLLVDDFLLVPNDCKSILDELCVSYTEVECTMKTLCYYN